MKLACGASWQGITKSSSLDRESPWDTKRLVPQWQILGDPGLETLESATAPDTVLCLSIFIRIVQRWVGFTLETHQLEVSKKLKPERERKGGRSLSILRTRNTKAGLGRDLSPYAICSIVTSHDRRNNRYGLWTVYCPRSRQHLDYLWSAYELYHKNDNRQQRSNSNSTHAEPTGKV